MRQLKVLEENEKSPIWRAAQWLTANGHNRWVPERYLSMFEKLRGLFGHREDKSSNAPSQSSQAQVEVPFRDGFSQQLSAIIERSLASSLESGCAVETVCAAVLALTIEWELIFAKPPLLWLKRARRSWNLELPVYIAGRNCARRPGSSVLCGRGRSKCWVYRRSLSGLSLQMKFSK